jgi:8-oxo-dGTP diphosphatase
MEPVKPFVNALASVKQMVIGIAFDFANNRVVLLVKNRPDWMAGCLNGVGGKVEPDETPLAAMVREFKQETGVLTTEEEWMLFHYEQRLDGPKLYFYCASMAGISGLVTSKTDEQVYSFDLDQWRAGLLAGTPMVYNLPLLVPMALCFLQHPQHRYDLSVN